MTLATLTLKLAHLSGQELNRAGDMGSGHWSPPPPAYMSNGLTYGPIYLETGSRFKVQLSYTMSSEFDVVVGDNLFDIELLNKADTSYTPPSDSHIYSAGYGVFIQFKAIPANQGVRYQSDRTPDGFELTLTYQENEAVSMNEPPIRGVGAESGVSGGSVTAEMLSQSS